VSGTRQILLSTRVGGGVLRRTVPLLWSACPAIRLASYFHGQIFYRASRNSRAKHGRENMRATWRKRIWSKRKAIVYVIHLQPKIISKFLINLLRCLLQLTHHSVLPPRDCENFSMILPAIYTPHQKSVPFQLLVEPIFFASSKYTPFERIEELACSSLISYPHHCHQSVPMPRAGMLPLGHSSIRIQGASNLVHAHLHAITFASHCVDVYKPVYVDLVPSAGDFRRPVYFP
jgi:hypothetical protein